VDKLKGSGPITVFAPTDEAFRQLPPGTLDDLLKPKNKEKLVKILTYHVISGDVKAQEIMKLDSAKSFEGGTLTIKSGEDGVTVTNAHVIKTDIAASNGVIQVVDAVLLPK
jgi:uncharacterized surface protein with fasciclin (FAS1) repeats